MRVLMVYNGENPVHVAFGEAVGAEPLVIKDRVTKRQLLPIKAWRLISNSLSIPRGHDAILTESCYYYPALKRRLVGLKGKIININCGPLLYHIASGRISGMQDRMLRSLLREVDAHLVFGEYGLEVLKRLDPGKPTGIVYPFISDEKLVTLLKLRPNLDSKAITIMANDDIICKGIDILVDAFNRVLEEEPEATLNIAGNIPEKDIIELDTKRSGRIRCLGTVKDVEGLLRGSSLYVHPSRGDTFPRASLEAMAAGVPAIVSEETGTKEIVGAADPEMVCKLSKKDLAERMIRYMQLPEEGKKKRSKMVRELVRPFNKEEQLENFRKRFKELA